MTAQEKVAAEVARLDKVLATRGAFYEDEECRHKALTEVAQWMEDDAVEAERIETEAAAAEQAEEETRRVNDPNYKTQQLFSTYRTKLKREGRMR